MAPKQRWEVEETTLENATKESKDFLKDSEFLIALIKMEELGKVYLESWVGAIFYEYKYLK